MKVKELITLLQTRDPEGEVVTGNAVSRYEYLDRDEPFCGISFKEEVQPDKYWRNGELPEVVIWGE